MEHGGDQAEVKNGAGDAHDLRLMTLLHQLVREHDLKGAAEELGVDARTLATSMQEDRLSRRVRVALERLLLAERDRAVHEQGERLSALEKRVDGLEERVGAMAEGLGRALSDVRSAVTEGTAAARVVEQRLARLESLHGGTAASRAKQDAHGEAPPARKPLRRQYPDIVTREPAPDDEDVYGAAWPLIEEWRRLWATHPSQGKGLAWLIADERILELEIAMLKEHGLTLPPATHPLRGRSSPVEWREAALDRVRHERAAAERRRWVRRVLTLGLWEQ